jgi:hypothetical protein
MKVMKIIPSKDENEWTRMPDVPFDVWSRRRDLAEASCRTVQRGSHIDSLPVEDNAPAPIHSRLMVPVPHA